MEIKLEKNEFGEWGYREFLGSQYGEWVPIYLNNVQSDPTSDTSNAIEWVEEKLIKLTAS